MRQFNWQALLKDGSKIRQFSPSGVELLFRVIQEEEQKGNLLKFDLINRPSNPAEEILKVGVNLTTGSFNSNFLFEEPFHHPLPDLLLTAQYRLIYYRRTRGTVNLVFGRRPEDAGPLDDSGDNWQSTKEGDYWGWIKDEKQLITPMVYRYLLGWQTTIEGKNYQRILFLDPVTLDYEMKEKR